jgi:oligoendopeptidase F
MKPLSTNPIDMLDWPWEQISPYYDDLLKQPLTEQNVDEWLKTWTTISQTIDEILYRLYIAITINTADKQAEARYNNFFDHIYPKSQDSEQKLKKKLLESGIHPQGFTVPLKNIRAEIAIFREENLALLAEEHKLAAEYDKIIGAQTVEWEGEEVTLNQLLPVYQNPDREIRERAWKLASQRQLNDRESLNILWKKLFELRQEITNNCQLPDYRAYRWQQLLRFDYTPEDCIKFHQAIEEVVVPAASRIYEKRRNQLGVKALRPWDLDVDAYGLPPLRPYKDSDELKSKTSVIFQKVDPQLGQYFDIMVKENLLDLDNRKNKAPGAYCAALATIRKPFIFSNAVGMHDDVITLLHESGHAFHVFESAQLPYFQQLQVGLEIAEVASMSMELLASPYLLSKHGGFYREKEAAQAKKFHLETIILFWPYMAVVDAFQHWAYTHPTDAIKPAQCDEQWQSLWNRFMPGVDWSGFENNKKMGWQCKQHIFQDPFYYVEYGLAEIGAVQIWRNALSNQADAVAKYRKALSLGASVPLPELYQTAGAKFAFDSCLLRELVNLIEKNIETTESILRE